MQCMMCQAEFAGAGNLCPACSQRFKGGGDDPLLKGLQQPARPAAEAKPAPAKPRPLGKEVWRVEADACDLQWPLGVALRPNGELLVLDQPEAYRLLRLDKKGKPLGRWIEIPAGNRPGELDDPQGFCGDATGRVLIADAGNDRVGVWGGDGKFQGLLGGPGAGPGEFARPADVDVDDEGSVYVADTFNHRIQKMSLDGLVLLEITDTGGGEFGEPVAVAVDADRNVWVADRERNCVHKFSPEGAPLLRLPPKGKAGLIQAPDDVFVGRDGGVCVSDFGNLRVQRFSTAGAMTGAVDRRAGDDDVPEGGCVAVVDGVVVVAERMNDRVVGLAFAEAKPAK